MIKAINLHKFYDELHVLKGVSLEIKKSEVISIVGASGTGKTTLLQILGTFYMIAKIYNIRKRKKFSMIYFVNS